MTEELTWQEVMELVAEVLAKYLKEDNIIKDLTQAIRELEDVFQKELKKDVFSQKVAELAELKEKAEIALRARKNARKILKDFIKGNKLLELF